METIEFLVQGSAPEPYTVTFTRKGSDLEVSCSCPSGGFSAACKHRLSIFEGKESGIVSANKSQVVEVAGWLPGSLIADRLAALSLAERDLEMAKEQVSRAKKQLARALGGKS